MTDRHYPAEQVRRQIELVLRAWGMPDRHIAVTADAMVETDLMGIDSHGVSMLILYEKMQGAGQLRLDAEPRVLRETAATALVDGGAGLGHPVAAMAMGIAVDKALAHDVGVVSVMNSHHFGACGTYAAMAARRKLIGVVATTSRIVTVVPTRAADRVLGTNPLCVAVPNGDEAPVILDMSTSIVSANKVKMAAFGGKPLPAGWVAGADGAPLTDAAKAYDLLFEGAGGGLSPVGGIGELLGGHKGYGLGLIVQILAGTLGGASFSPTRNKSQAPSDPDNIGHFFMALNPAAFRPLEDFERDLADIVATLRSTTPLDRTAPVLVPGDPEWTARRERLRTGIPLPDDLVAKLRDIATGAGAPFVLRG